MLLFQDTTAVVWYMDESSVHSWTTLRSTYMHKTDKFSTSIRTKGEWFTIFGAIGGTLGGEIQHEYEILNTTNKENTLWFLQKLRALTSLRVQVTVFLDNHR